MRHAQRLYMRYVITSFIILDCGVYYVNAEFNPSDSPTWLAQLIFSVKGLDWSRETF